MGKILVKASRPQTMMDAQGNIQFLYSGNKEPAGIVGTGLGTAGKVIGAGLGAAGPHRNLLSLLQGVQSGASTGETAGRYFGRAPFGGIDAVERYFRRPKKRTPQQVYAEEYGKEKKRQQIRRDVSRELRPQTQEEALRSLLLQTGNNPAIAQRLLGIFSGQGNEVKHNTANSLAAKVPMAHPNKTRPPEGDETNPSLPPTAVGVTQPPPLPTSQTPLPAQLEEGESKEDYADKMETLAQQAKMNNEQSLVAVT